MREYLLDSRVPDDRHEGEELVRDLAEGTPSVLWHWEPIDPKFP